MLRHLLDKCRYVIAVLAAVFVAWFVWQWPQQPLWRSPENVGWPRSFSPDGAVIVTEDRPANANPVVYRWDATTGRLISRAVMECTNKSSFFAASVSADGTRVLVCEQSNSGTVPLMLRLTRSVPTVSPSRFSAAAGRSILIFRGNWFLHDAVTGKRIAEIPGEEVSFGQTAFSLDNRWFVNEQWQGDDTTIFSAITGKSIAVRANPMKRPGQSFLAPDGSSVAIMQLPAEYDLDGRLLFTIVELPSGNDLFKFELPQRQGFEVDNWDGNRLHAHVTEMGADKKPKQVNYVAIDPSHNPPQEIRDPMLVAIQDFGKPPRYCRDGTESIAYVNILSVPEMTELRPWYHGLLRRLERQINTAYVEPQGVNVRVSVVDRETKATTFTSQVPLKLPMLLSPSGRLLASCNGNEGIAVYDTNPGPRWPWAVGAGSFTLGLSWLLGRIRWRRTPLGLTPTS